MLAAGTYAGDKGTHTLHNIRAVVGFYDNVQVHNNSFVFFPIPRPPHLLEFNENILYRGFMKEYL